MTADDLAAFIAQNAGDPQQHDALFSRLLSEELYIVTPPTGDNGARTVGENESIEIVNYEMEDGTPFIPVFTSMKMLEDTIDIECGYAAMNGLDIFNMLQGSAIIIDPAHDHALYLTGEDLRDILQHYAPELVGMEAGSEVAVGIPAENPAALKKALSDFFARHAAVTGAYLCLMIEQATDNASIIVGVTFAKGKDDPKLLEKAAMIGKPHVPPDHALDLMVIVPDGAEDIAAYLLKDGDQFYEA